MGEDSPRVWERLLFQVKHLVKTPRSPLPPLRHRHHRGNLRPSRSWHKITIKVASVSMISGANADKWIFCTNYQLARSCLCLLCQRANYSIFASSAFSSQLHPTNNGRRVSLVLRKKKLSHPKLELCSIRVEWQFTYAVLTQNKRYIVGRVSGRYFFFKSSLKY